MDRSYSRSPSPQRSRSPRRSPRRRSPSRSYSRSPSPRRRSISAPRRRSISTKDKYALYKYQKEYVFPVGIHQDIDENIIKQLDFDGLINLLTVDRSPQLRKIVHLHIQDIIDNTPDFEYKNLDYSQQLLLLRELTLIKKLNDQYKIHNKNFIIKNLAGYIETGDQIQLMDYLSMIDKKQSESYIYGYTKDIDLKDIGYILEQVNLILDAAILINNTTIIRIIKNWYKNVASNTYQQLQLLTTKLNL